MTIVVMVGYGHHSLAALTRWREVFVVFALGKMEWMAL